jgi:hypothetical protein
MVTVDDKNKHRLDGRLFKLSWHEIYEDKRIFKVNENQKNFGKNKLKSNSKHIT